MKNGNNKTKFIYLQTKYEIKNKELDPHYFKETIKTNRNAFNKTNSNKNKKEINRVIEAHNDDSSSNQKSEDNENNRDKRSESNRIGRENDDKDSGNGSGSASGSGSGT